MEEQMSVILKEKLSASKVEIEDTSGGALVVVRPRVTLARKRGLLCGEGVGGSRWERGWGAAE